MKYGYARTSTKKQKLESQVNLLIENGVNKSFVFTDQSTGTKKEGRNGYNELLEVLKEGDTVIFYTVDRMSRNEVEGYEDYMNLVKKGVKLEFIANPSMNSEVYGTQLVDIAKIKVDNELMNETLMRGIRDYLKALLKKQISAEFKKAEDEARKIAMKVKLGVKKAKSNGTIGRKKGCDNSHLKKEVPKKFIKDWKNGIGVTHLSKIHGVTRTTVYRWIKQEMAQEGN